MSRSFHTDRPDVIAQRNIQSKRHKKPLAIVERKLKNNDIHPLPKSVILDTLDMIPIEYLNGLTKIELKQRPDNNIGKPFGFYSYSANEKVITLYSLPLKWKMKKLSNYLKSIIPTYYGVITTDENGDIEVAWPHQYLLMMWYNAHVFYRNLGRHYCNQYRQKRHEGSRKQEERLAIIKSHRLSLNFWKQYNNEERVAT